MQQFNLYVGLGLIKFSIYILDPSILVKPLEMKTAIPGEMSISNEQQQELRVRSIRDNRF